MNKKSMKYIGIEVIAMIIFLVLVQRQFIDTKVLNENHFNLITINAIFAGFLFSSLALIVGLFNDKVLIRLERANFLDDIYRKIMFGITNSLVSIVISLLNIFVNPRVTESITGKYLWLKTIITTYLFSLELFFLIATIVLFILSVRNIRFIIKSVRERVRSELPKNIATERVIERIKKSQSEQKN